MKPAPRNRLASEASPYLRQHERDPVDWYPWGTEALELARREQKPIFLSVGYSACHWCHVMARESFADEGIARLLQPFVAVKVDREERPEIDALYLDAVRTLTGSAGWPLTVFLTPDLEPFFGGTYFPPVAGPAGPGLADLLQRLAAAWQGDRALLTSRARELVGRMRRNQALDARGELPEDVLERSARALAASADELHGGFGGAPKFPRPLDLRLSLRHALRSGRAEAAEHALLTLRAMADGGLNDQLAGGFHRYSTDERWRVPHFEKMLSDSALLVPAFLEAWQWSAAPELAETARRTCEWMRTEMQLEGGGFASALDADTEGDEGRYYTWTAEEVIAAVGAEQAWSALELFGIDEESALEDGRSVLRMAGRPDGLDLPGLRRALLDARERRTRPGRDEKLLPGPNGLAVSALCKAYQCLGDERDLTAALDAARAVERRLVRPDGGVYASWCADRGRGRATAQDLALLAQAWIDLFETDFDPAWLETALAWTEQVERQHGDPERGGYFLASDAAPELPLRIKIAVDDALPSALGVQCLNLLRLAELTGRGPLTQAAQVALRSSAATLARYPAAFSSVLLAVDHLREGPYEIVITGERDAPDTRALLEVAWRSFLPQRVLALAHADVDESLLPLTAGKTSDGAAQAYVCRNWSCEAPLEDPDELAERLGESCP